MSLFGLLTAGLGLASRETLSPQQMASVLSELLLWLAERKNGFTSGTLTELLEKVEGGFENQIHVRTERHWGICEVAPVPYGATGWERFTWPGPWEKRVVGPVCRVPIRINRMAFQYEHVYMFAREDGLFPIVTYEVEQRGGGGFSKRYVATRRDTLLIAGSR